MAVDSPPEQPTLPDRAKVSPSSARQVQSRGSNVIRKVQWTFLERRVKDSPSSAKETLTVSPTPNTFTSSIQSWFTKFNKKIFVVASVAVVGSGLAATVWFRNRMTVYYFDFLDDYRKREHESKLLALERKFDIIEKTTNLTERSKAEAVKAKEQHAVAVVKPEKQEAA